MTNIVSVNVLVDVRCDGDATGEKVRMIDIVFVSPSVSVLFALHEGLFVLVATRDAVWVVVIVLLAEAGPAVAVGVIDDVRDTELVSVGPEPETESDRA